MSQIASKLPSLSSEQHHPSTHTPSQRTNNQPYSIFDRRQKAVIVLLATIAATFSGFASNIYFPALPTIAKDLNVSIELVNLSVTCYLIFQGISPSFWGPISDAKGRRVAYICTFTLFIGACIGLAKTPNYATLIALRCIQSTGSASTIAIGSGVLGDVTTREERGGYMGIFQAGLLVPVAVGPVIGGALAGSFGWRSIFWFLTIYCGIFLLMLILLLPETLRSIVGNGSQNSTGWISSFPLRFYQKFTSIQHKRTAEDSRPPVKSINILDPILILFSGSAVVCIAFVAVYYAVWQMSITAMSSLFESRYGLNETQIGLTFIANGVGSMIGTLLTGKILDRDYCRIKAQYEASETSSSDKESDGAAEGAAMKAHEDNFPIEKARLRLLPIFALVQCFSILLFGWTVRFSSSVPIAVPIVSTFFTGWTAVSIQSAVMTYLVDVFHDRSAAASASVNLARCLFAAGGTSFVMPMIGGIDAGWAFSICALVQLLALGVMLLRLLLRAKKSNRN